MSRRVERRFVNPEQISRHLFCSICTDVFLDPTRLFCSHTFCKKCITHWNKDHNTCPICRVEIQIELTGKDLIADKMIQDLLVSCPNTGCTWKDVLENLEKHNKTCGFSKSPDWLVRDQNYIKIEEESEDNSTAWTDLKSFPPIAVGFQSPNGQILARGPEDVYCMTYWHAFYAPNPEVTKQFFDSVMSHSNRGSRRNSGSGNYAFGLPNNIMIPIYRPVEEMNTDSRDDDIIVLDESTSSSENPSSLGKSQKRKKNTVSINDKVCGNTKSSRKVKSSQLHTIHDDGDGNENYGRSNSRRELGKYISIGEDSSENKLVKKTKAGVV